MSVRTFIRIAASVAIVLTILTGALSNPPGIVSADTPPGAVAPPFTDTRQDNPARTVVTDATGVW